MKEPVYKEFQIGSFFDVVRGNAKNITKREISHNSIAVVSAIDSNNGVSGSTKPIAKETVYDNKLTVHNNGNGVGLVFFHSYKFIATSDVTILLPKNNFLLNRSTALYIKAMLELQRNKFSYGYKLSNDRLKAQKLLLPSDKSGNPDYAFMKNYMGIIEKEQLIKYKHFIKDRLMNLEKGGLAASLSSKEWGEFELAEIFDIKPGMRLTKAEMIKGDIPFVGATDSNNGITAFVSNENNSVDRNILGVNYNGSVVENFYHPYTAIFSDDVKRLTLRNIEGNRFLYLFVKTQILKQKAKYQYGYKFNARRMNRQKIMLPITQHNKPDYQFMEKYMKKLEYICLKKYLTHVSSKII